MSRNVGPVQVPMAGLYGMLGVKDGSNPDIITGFVQPTIDAAPWWYHGARELLQVWSTINADGTLQQINLGQTPATEWWRIESWNLQGSWDASTYAAGMNLQLRITDAVGNLIYETPPAIAGVGPPDQVDTLGIADINVEGLWVPPQSVIIAIFKGANGTDLLTVGPMYGVKARI